MNCGEQMASSSLSSSGKSNTGNVRWALEGGPWSLCPHTAESAGSGQLTDTPEQDWTSALRWRAEGQGQRTLWEVAVGRFMCRPRSSSALRFCCLWAPGELFHREERDWDWGACLGILYGSQDSGTSLSIGAEWLGVSTSSKDLWSPISLSLCLYRCCSLTWAGSMVHRRFFTMSALSDNPTLSPGGEMKPREDIFLKMAISSQVLTWSILKIQRIFWYLNILPDPWVTGSSSFSVPGPLQV